ncbi:hypothetical protein H257_05080 [Aphanomyces astaci]|uniref:Uncharacterized protein n=1 Tax=Aphanomyces astaci TaxID=112090 RepID=W4GRW4_APHAT|nr:hypothetical protein H257_05080 [Aphanomyces astaci]ETV82442.1 hypothetical protein H257_05080 [Aphanomyces astaci]|eukprot:XP_009828111.1 hypothetical protein H257_05080 [Aphanomyces astaci]
MKWLCRAWRTVFSEDSSRSVATNSGPPALYYKYVDDLDDDDAKDADERWSVVLRALRSHWTECTTCTGPSLIGPINDAVTLERSNRVLSEYRAWSQYQPTLPTGASLGPKTACAHVS